MFPDDYAKESILSNPLVSIVVPVYNGSNYIDTFFSCMAKQSFGDYEVIVVDDGSKDDSYEKSLMYSEKDSRINVYKKENGGPGSARNYGIDKASGDYIVFFDIDDEFSESVLEENAGIALKGAIDVVMWNFTMVILETEKRYYRQIGVSCSVDRSEFFHSFLIPTLDNEMFNPPWNKMINRQLLIDNNIRFHTEYRLYEDILFSYEVCKKAKSFAINDKSYYTYLIKSEGSLLTKFHPECFDAIHTIYKTALSYGESFKDNSRQISRFKEQFIYLTKGYVKQICVNKSMSLSEKREALARIGSNPDFRAVSLEKDKGMRRLPARFMMRHGLYRSLIVFYHILEALNCHC